MFSVRPCSVFFFVMMLMIPAAPSASYLAEGRFLAQGHNVRPFLFVAPETTGATRPTTRRATTTGAKLSQRHSHFDYQKQSNQQQSYWQ